MFCKKSKYMVKRRIVVGIVFIALAGLSAPAFAQTKVDKAAHGVKKGASEGAHGVKKGATKAWEGTKKGAHKVGEESTELAAKGKARVSGNKSELWIGPQGQTIYTDGNRYYWINGSGKRIYVSKSALRARTKS
jgi:hypothetical protein